MSEYDIIIVGGGPAGLSAAIYGLRAGKKVLILEGKALGGQIINAFDIQNYPGLPNISGMELATRMRDQVKELGGEIRFERVMGIKDKIARTDGGEYKARAIILATGAENRKLGLYSEEKFIGRGVSYCATCDGSLYKGKTVAVVGGGNTALEDVVYLADIAKKVYLIHRREEFRGDRASVQRVHGLKNVEMVLSANVREILGDGRVTGIEVEFADGEEKTIDVDGVFFAIGYEPRAGEFADLVELDEDGYIKSEDGVHTSVEGVYVAGDVRKKKLKQLVTAVADGAMAATTAVREME